MKYLIEVILTKDAAVVQIYKEPFKVQENCQAYAIAEDKYDIGRKLYALVEAMKSNVQKSINHCDNILKAFEEFKCEYEEFEGDRFYEFKIETDEAGSIKLNLVEYTGDLEVEEDGIKVYYPNKFSCVKDTKVERAERFIKGQIKLWSSHKTVDNRAMELLDKVYYIKGKYRYQCQ